MAEAAEARAGHQDAHWLSAGVPQGEQAAQGGQHAGKGGVALVLALDGPVPDKVLESLRDGHGVGHVAGRLSLAVAFGYELAPSPLTPTGPNDPYQILAGTIRGAIADSDRDRGRSVIVVPQIERGNTGQLSALSFER